MNNPAAAAVRKLTAGLKATLQELFGATLHLSASTVAMTFPTAFDRLHVSFYRSKITSWMAAQEEDYRWLYPCFCNEHPNTKGMGLDWLKCQYIGKGYSDEQCLAIMDSIRLDVKTCSGVAFASIPTSNYPRFSVLTLFGPNGSCAAQPVSIIVPFFSFLQVHPT